MKRNIFAGVLVSAAVLLASCTSTSTTATQTSVSNSPAGPAGATSGGAPSSDTASSDAPSSGAPSSDTPSSDAASSDAPSSDTASVPGSPALGSSAPESSAPASSAASSPGLDDATTAWFTAFCGGLTPVLGAEKDVKTKEAAVAKTDYAAQQKLLVDFLATAGPRLTVVGSTLKSLPAPTFKGGAAFAAKVVEAFGKTGPGLTATGQKLAAVDVSKSPSGLSAAAPNLAAELASIAAPITAVGDLDIPDSTKAALLALPACAKLQSTVTG